MESGGETLVQDAILNFLKQHSLPDHVGSIDEIVLTYVISILEDLGDGSNTEENIDVDQFVEMMDAYIPGFGSIPSVEICEWMFELATTLSKSRSSDAGGVEPTSPTLATDLALGASGGATSSDLNSAGESERSTSESSDEVDEQLQLLMEMFPETLRIEVEHCYSTSEGDLEKAAQILLYRQESGVAITSSAKNTERKKNSFIPPDDKKAKQLLVARYSYIDEDEDKKTHKPTAPKTEPKKLVRYLDGKVVNTKGNRFTEIKKEDDEEMKKTYVNLKPARKYRFH